MKHNHVLVAYLGEVVEDQGRSSRPSGSSDKWFGQLSTEISGADSSRISIIEATATHL